jgi:hypothetical protein
LATILEVPREAVPDIPPGPEWILLIQQWLGQFGLGIQGMRALVPESLPMFPPGLVIAGGKSSGGVDHSCVYRAVRRPGGIDIEFELAHDPWIEPNFIAAHREALTANGWYPGLQGTYQDWNVWFLVVTDVRLARLTALGLVAPDPVKAPAAPPPDAPDLERAVSEKGTQGHK